MERNAIIEPLLDQSNEVFACFGGMHIIQFDYKRTLDNYRALIQSIRQMYRIGCEWLDRTYLFTKEMGPNSLREIVTFGSLWSTSWILCFQLMSCICRYFIKDSHLLHAPVVASCLWDRDHIVLWDPISSIPLLTRFHRNRMSIQTRATKFGYGVFTVAFWIWFLTF